MCWIFAGLQLNIPDKNLKSFFFPDEIFQKINEYTGKNKFPGIYHLYASVTKLELRINPLKPNNFFLFSFRLWLSFHSYAHRILSTFITSGFFFPLTKKRRRNDFNCLDRFNNKKKKEQKRNIFLPFSFLIAKNLSKIFLFYFFFFFLIKIWKDQVRLSRKSGFHGNALKKSKQRVGKVTKSHWM